ncbi:MAG: lipopolysaccharide export system protein LptA [Flavobacteriaceae bacterium]
MIKKYHILKSALLGCALFLLPICVLAQGNILELLPGSDRLAYDDATGKARLIGNVSFLYQGNKMYCDSAHYYQRRNVVYAYGKVHINKRDTLNLFCDSLFYDGNTRKAKLWGNVRVRDDEYKLTTDSLDYDARKSQASYTNGGRVQSILRNEVLTSQVGYFHPESKNFFFSRDVVYESDKVQMTTDTLRYRYSEKKTYFYGPTNIHTVDTDIYCESGWYNTQTEEGLLQQDAWIQRETDYISGDTLLYQPLEGTSIGKGNVYYIDSTQQISFKADYALISDSLHYSYLTGHALAIKELDDDTLYIHADTLYSYKLDSVEFMRAHSNAGIYGTKFQCKADSISYSPTKERIELFRDPIVWSNGAELKGDSIDVHLSDSVIHLVTIRSHATLLMDVAKDTLFNQIAGTRIIAYFKDNDLYQAKVHGNAMTIFYPVDEEKTDSTIIKKRMGMNRLYSSDLRIDIDSSEITGITYLEEPDGVLYPMNRIDKKEQFVPGFEWLELLRPNSFEDLFMRKDLPEIIENEAEEDVKEAVELIPIEE